MLFTSAPWATYLILLSFLLLTSTNINISSTYAKDVFQEEIEQVEPVQETEEVQAIEEPTQLEEIQQETIEESEEEKERKKKEELERLFFAAIHKADVDKTLELIAQGADVNSRYCAWTPLMIASTFGHKEMAATLIKAGADINLSARSHTIVNPLRLAITGGHVDIVQMLINAGAKINAIYDEEGNLEIPPAITFLPEIEKPSNTFTSTYNHILMLLLAAGADADVKVNETSDEEKFMPPLMTAVCLGNLEAANLLIACGADVNYKAKNGLTAYICAEKTNQQDMLEILKSNGAEVKKASKKTKHPDIPTTQYVGKTGFIPGFGPTKNSDDPLSIISVCEEKEITDINAKDENGDTIFMRLLESSSHSDEYIKFLSASGSSLNIENNNGENALLIASGSNIYCIPSLETLLRAGANTDSRDKTGKTPLIKYVSGNKGCSCSIHYVYSDFHRSNEIIKLLIAAGADINAQDTDGKTALMYAFEKDSEQGFFLLTKTLLEMGADPTIKDNNNISFLDLLKKQNLSQNQND